MTSFTQSPVRHVRRIAAGISALSIVALFAGCAAVDVGSSGHAEPIMSSGSQVTRSGRRVRGQSLDGLAERPRDGMSAQESGITLTGRRENTPYELPPLVPDPIPNRYPTGTIGSRGGLINPDRGVSSTGIGGGLDRPASQDLYGPSNALDYNPPSDGRISNVSSTETRPANPYGESPTDSAGYDDYDEVALPPLGSSSRSGTGSAKAVSEVGNQFAVTEVEMEYVSDTKMYVNFTVRVLNDRRERMIVKGGVFRLYLGDDLVGKATSNDSYALNPGQYRDQECKLQMFNRELFNAFRDMLSSGGTPYQLRAKMYYQRSSSQQSVLTYDVNADGRLNPAD